MMRIYSGFDENERATHVYIAYPKEKTERRTTKNSCLIEKK